MYVQPASIVPTTGAIASRDARVSQLFIACSELRSDLRSRSAAAARQLSPMTFSQRYSWSLTYTLANRREQYRGFPSTVGNPQL